MQTVISYPTPLPCSSPSFSFCRQNSLLWIGDKNQCPLKDMSRPLPCEVFKAYQATLYHSVKGCACQGFAAHVRQIPSFISHEWKGSASIQPEGSPLQLFLGDSVYRACNA